MARNYDSPLVFGYPGPTVIARTTFTSLEEAQKIVGHYVEVVRTVPDFYGEPVVILVDEDGIPKDLPFNLPASQMAGQALRGNALLLVGRVAQRGWTWEASESEDLSGAHKKRCPTCRTPFDSRRTPKDPPDEDPREF